ncbi:hypothetical protein [Desulfonatronovibrio hydrogenovorans]|nr:hypothetical protein [Desulfonatronovibrio hydrogenovorans]
MENQPLRHQPWLGMIRSQALCSPKDQSNPDLPVQAGCCPARVIIIKT